MKHKKYSVIGAIFTIISGVLLHFAYDAFPSDFTAIFTPVNESTWEHLKLLFFPVMAFAIAEYFIYGKNLPNFWASKVIALIVGMLAIVTVFYSYTGVVGKDYAVINIMLFVTCAILTYYLSYCFMDLGAFDLPLLGKAAIFTAVIIFALFWVFTFYPPLINLFRDPVTGGFGI